VSWVLASFPQAALLKLSSSITFDSDLDDVALASSKQN